MWNGDCSANDVSRASSEENEGKGAEKASFPDPTSFNRLDNHIETRESLTNNKMNQ